MKNMKNNSNLKEIPNGEYEAVIRGQDVFIESLDKQIRVIKGIGGKSKCRVRSYDGVIKVYIQNKIFLPEL